MTLTAEAIEQSIKDTPSRCFMNTEDLENVMNYCRSKGMTETELKITGEAIFRATLATYAIGFQRGRNYEKRHRRQRHAAGRHET